MTQRIDLAVINKPVREFIRDLGTFHETIELMVEGDVVAKLIPATELSDQEKQRVLHDGWEVVKKARANASEVSALAVQRMVDQAVQEVKGRNDQRRN